MTNKSVCIIRCKNNIVRGLLIYLKEHGVKIEDKDERRIIRKNRVNRDMTYSQIVIALSKVLEEGLSLGKREFINITFSKHSKNFAIQKMEDNPSKIFVSHISGRYYILYLSHEAPNKLIQATKNKDSGDAISNDKACMKDVEYYQSKELENKYKPRHDNNTSSFEEPETKRIKVKKELTKTKYYKKKFKGFLDRHDFYECNANSKVYVYDIETNFIPSKDIKTKGQFHLKPAILSYSYFLYHEMQSNLVNTEILNERLEVFKGYNCVKEFVDLILSIIWRNKKDPNINSEDEQIIVFAHYARKMEHVYIMDAIASTSIITDDFVFSIPHSLDNKALSINIGKVRFSDSFNYTGKSLNDSAKAFGLEITKTKTMALEEFKRIDWRKPSKENLEYSKTDTIILALVVVKVFSFFNELATTMVRNACKRRGDKKIIISVDIYKCYSLSSIAKNILLAVHPQIAPSDTLNSYFQKYYMGGTTECFVLDCSDNYSKEQNMLAHKVDINSAYPNAMQHSVPGECILAVKIRNKEELNKMLKDKRYIYFIEAKPKYDTSKMPKTHKHMPVLSTRKEGKLIRPLLISGEVFMPIWDFEYEYIKDYTDLEDITLMVFHKTTYKVFVDELYQIKKNSTGGRRETAKQILNTAYGGLGVKSVRTTIEIECGLIATNIGYSYIKAIVPQAAYITAKTRFDLTLQGHNIIDKGGTLMYMDTDSIIYTHKNPNIVKHGDGLGEWKFEGTTDNWNIINYKHYVFGKEIKIKGMGKSVVDAEGLKDAYYMSHNKIVGSREIVLVSMFKTVKSKPSKRVFFKEGTIPNKYNSTPIEL